MRIHKSTQPKYKVGDIVEVSARNPVQEREGEKLGIIAFIEKGADITEYTSKSRKGEFYAYYYDRFDGREDSAVGSWLRRCKGMRHKKLCSDCWYFQLCLKSPLYCDTGGRLVTKRCNKCYNRFKCWTDRQR